MPSDSSTSNPGSEFLEDFYAECDQHLVEIRRALLHLEEQAGDPAATPQIVEKIYRSLHSVKGICGMAGLQSAERLAHAAEDYLRAITRHESQLTPEGLEALTEVSKALEQLVVAHRQGQPEVGVNELVEKTAALSQDSKRRAPSGGLESRPFDQPSEAVLALIQTAVQQGKQVFRCVFKPAPELDRRGVNVGFVRTQLQGLGEILHAAPKVQAGGELLFEFLLAAQNEPAELERLADDGIQVSLLKEGASHTGGENKPPVQPSTAAPPTLTSPFMAPSHFVRIELGRLDELMRMLGELVVQQARLEEGLGRVTPLLPSSESRGLQETRHALGRDLRHLRDGIMRLRLVPIGEVFDRLPFVVRDLTRESGKKVRLVVKGEDTELDKYLVEQMKDPLLHLVRNAVSHGIEPAAERLAQAKPIEGTITIKASTIAETVVIEAIDDGRGIDRTAIAAKAQREGIPVSETLNNAEVLELLCTPGFSTRDTADLGAGRGMGMAAVHNTIIELGGELELETTPNSGSTFRMRLPLTLAVADALIISAGGQRFAMPHSVVQEITTVEPAAINRLEQNEIVRHRNGVLPLLRLSTIFGLKSEARNGSPVLVIGTGLNAVGIVTDRVLGHREIVVRPIKDPLLKVAGISGATELGDGQPVLILDSVSLTQTAKMRQMHSRRSSAPAKSI